MAIRLRTVEHNGERIRVALCAVESDAMPGDVYLDDGDHSALAAKFCRDWRGEFIDWSYPDEWAAMDTQKLRDAAEEFAKWDAVQMDYSSPTIISQSHVRLTTGSFATMCGVCGLEGTTGYAGTPQCMVPFAGSAKAAAEAQDALRRRGCLRLNR